MKTIMPILVAATLPPVHPQAHPAADANIQVNGARTVELEPGQPWIVTVTVSGPDGVRDIAAKALLSITLDGTPVDAPLLDRSLSAVRTGELQLVTRLWTVSPDATRNLIPGRYHVMFTAGDLAADWAAVEIRSSFPPDDTQHIAARQLALSHWHQIEGDIAAALAVVDELVSQQPANLSARVRKADLLAIGERWTDALLVLDEAEIRYMNQNPDAHHPPMLVRQRQRQMLQRIEALALQ